MRELSSQDAVVVKLGSLSCGDPGGVNPLVGSQDVRKADDLSIGSKLLEPNLKASTVPSSLQFHHRPSHAVGVPGSAAGGVGPLEPGFYGGLVEVVENVGRQVHETAAKGVRAGEHNPVGGGKGSWRA